MLLKQQNNNDGDYNNNNNNKQGKTERGLKPTTVKGCVIPLLIH